MARELTASQKRAMRKGRTRWERERAREAIRRVRAYRRWLRAGCRLGDIPPIPSDSDYRLARGAGEPYSIR